MKHLTDRFSALSIFHTLCILISSSYLAVWKDLTADAIVGLSSVASVDVGSRSYNFF